MANLIHNQIGHMVRPDTPGRHIKGDKLQLYMSTILLILDKIVSFCNLENILKPLEEY